MINRGSFAPNVIDSALVTGKSVSPESITVGGNWYRVPPEGAVAITIEIDRRTAVEAFQSYYDDYVADGRRFPPDAEEVSGNGSSPEWQLMEAGWPTLERLMADRPRLYEALVVDLAFDFLNELFRLSGRVETGFAICQIDVAALGERALVLRGHAMPF